MKMMIDSLKSVKLMDKKGVDRNLSEAFIEVACDTEIGNLYSKDEVNNMLAQSVQDVLTESRREFDKRLDAQREDMKSQREDMKSQFTELKSEFAEFKTTKRWIIGLVLTVGTTWIVNLFHPLMNITH